MKKIVIFGKGGIGKSTIAVNLSALYNLEGKRVLHIGCDPKSDSVLLLNKGERIKTVVDIIGDNKLDIQKLSIENIIYKTYYGVDAIESGGPNPPGEGCAGLGLLQTFEVIQKWKDYIESKYDVIIFDVLGDIVCGGFAVPIRKGFGDKVIIVVSEDLMSLYAANNIMQIINNYSYTGAKLVGLVINKVINNNISMTQKFSKITNSKILAKLEYNKEIQKSEKEGKILIEVNPKHKFSLNIYKLKKEIDKFNLKQAKKIKPINKSIFFEIMSNSKRTTKSILNTKNFPIENDKYKMKNNLSNKTFSEINNIININQKSNNHNFGKLNKNWNIFLHTNIPHIFDSFIYEGPHTFIALEDKECYYSSSSMNEEEKIPFIKYPITFKIGNPKYDTSLSDIYKRITIDLDQKDVITGISSKIKEISKIIKNNLSKPDFILLQQGCISNIIGTDLKHWKEYLRKETNVPVFTWDCVNIWKLAKDNNNLSIFFKHFMEILFNIKKRRNMNGKNQNLPCAFLGYGNKDSVEELSWMLNSIYKVDIPFFLPNYNKEDLKNFWNAKAIIINNAVNYDFLEKIINKYCDKKVIRLEAPVGFETTKEWLKQIGKICGNDNEIEKIIKNVDTKYINIINKIKKESSKHTVYFIVDNTNINRFMDKRFSFGFSILDFLLEFNFKIKLLIYGDDLTKSLTKSLITFKKELIYIENFKNEEELYKKLLAPECSMIYSDFLSDYRIAKVGKPQLSLDFFKCGFKSSIITAEKILALCNANFYNYGKN